MTPTSLFLGSLLDSLRSTIRSLRTESLLRVHELLARDAHGARDDVPPDAGTWAAAVALVEDEFARRGLAVRSLLREV